MNRTTGDRCPFRCDRRVIDGEPVESDVLICSDHRSAISQTAEILGGIPGIRPLDAGELSNAAPIEAFAAVLLQLNIRYKTRVAVRFTGIPTDS